MASDRPEVKDFFSRLHAEVLKPQGFTKNRWTFTKKYEGYSLAFQFQGSNWNSADEPWRFYINTGIQFADLPRRTPDKDFPRIHSWTRVGNSLSASAEQQYDVIPKQIDKLIRNIETIVTDCLKYFTDHHEILKNAYTQRLVPYLGYLDEALMKKVTE